MPKPKLTAPKGGGMIIELDGATIDLLLVNYIGPIEKDKHRITDDEYYFTIDGVGSLAKAFGFQSREKAEAARAWLLEKLGWVDIEVYEPELKK